MEIKELNEPGLNLLQKGQKGIFRALISRLGIIVLLLIAQVVVAVVLFQKFDAYLPQFYTAMIGVSVLMVFYLINGDMNPTVKITWLTLIALTPVLGCILLLYTQTDAGHRAVRDTVRKTTVRSINLIPQDPETMREVKESSPDTAALAHYVRRTGCFPVYKDTDVTYFPSGEAKFYEMINQLERAEKFIFLEYFIIDEGLMWGRILDILARKAKEGVDVRVMYDGTCEFSTLPRNYPKLLRNLGIQCKVFSPVKPFLSTHYNYRDHRKILVVDGHTAFTGGINLADEYINHIERFGHWKDTAIMLQGEGVKSFTLMFLQVWNSFGGKSSYEPYLNCHTYPSQNAKGYVIPFTDCPLDPDKVGERVYMDILNRAQEYVYIMTPYLILDGEMETALKFAAERGVDVRLILPGIPDKKMAYALAYTHYATLLESGVRIYEYTPGFVHAKVFVSDDCKAVVGTINLDYRSLYHHFECACYLADVPCIQEIEKDFLETMEKCRRVTRQSMKKEKLSRRLSGFICKTVAPLM